MTYCHSSSAHRALELLPKAPPPEPRKLTEKELKQLNQQEEATMRELRLFLRDILNKLGRDRKFQIFAKPVDEAEVMKKLNLLNNLFIREVFLKILFDLVLSRCLSCCPGS